MTKYSPAPNHLFLRTNWLAMLLSGVCPSVIRSKIIQFLLLVLRRTAMRSFDSHLT